MEYINQFMEGDGWQKYLVAAIILVVGYFVSLFLKMIVSGGINRTGIGKRAKTTGGNIGSAFGKATFWLALLYTLYLALSRLGMGDHFAPIENLFTSITSFLPNLIGAALTLVIGFAIAKVGGMATTSVLEAAQVDNLANKSGLSDATGSKGSIAKALGTLVFVMIIVPVFVAAISALQIEAISTPLSNMLNGFLEYIPQLVSAAVILGLTIFIGRYASNFLAGFLPTLGFDRSINEIVSLDDGEGLKTSPSKAAGYLVFLITLVVGVSAAVNVLANESLSEAFGAVQTFGGQLLRAAVLIIIGVFLANLVGRFMGSMISPKIASFVKYTAMVLFIFLGLSTLDPDGQIIPVAFSAFVIAAAVAGAIAFGLGGREWASKILNKAFPPADVQKMSSASKPAARRAPPPKK